MSSAPFDRMDYPYTIERVQRTGGPLMDQSTGAITAPTETVTTITGNFRPYSAKRGSGIGTENAGPVAGGNLKEGDVFLWTEDALAPGDSVRIYEDGSGNTYRTYRVMGVHDDVAMLYNLVGVPTRKKYQLRLEEEI